MADQWKPRREDGYRLCEELHETCSCRERGAGPCSSLARVLRDCRSKRLKDPAAYERRRIQRAAERAK